MVDERRTTLEAEPSEVIEEIAPDDYMYAFLRNHVVEHYELDPEAVESRARANYFRQGRSALESIEIALLTARRDYVRRLRPGSTAPAGVRQGVDEHCRMVKSIVSPKRVARPLSPHRFIYRDGDAMDENAQPLDRRFTRSLSLGRLRINHYYTRSEEECRLKLSRPRPDNGEVYDARETVKLFADYDLQFGVPDKTITTYVPALRAALQAPGKAA